MNAQGAPTISVIIAAYNAEKYIAQAIDSVLAQSHAAVECIVVDDGSTDRTAEVARSYGARVRYIHQQNAERSAARNNGIAHAAGTYLCFLDADDLLAPEKLAEQAAFLDAHPEFDVVYSRVAYFKERDGSSFSPRRKTPSGDILAELIYSNFITIHSPLIRRAALERTDGFDVTRNRYEDWDFLLRLALAGARFAFLDRLHAKVRLHPENTIGDRVKMFDAKLSVAEKIAAQYRGELERQGIDPDRVLAFHRADYGRVLVLAGMTQEGRALISGALRHPFPHRNVFVLFNLAAGILGHRALMTAQEAFDRIVKGKRGGSAEGGS